jgi:hypothetical protein
MRHPPAQILNNWPHRLVFSRRLPLSFAVRRAFWMTIRHSYISRGRYIGAKGLKLRKMVYDIVAWNTQMIRFALIYRMHLRLGLRLCVTWIYQNWLISAWANRERAIKPGRRDKPFIVCANPQIGCDAHQTPRFFPDACTPRTIEQLLFSLRLGWTRAQSQLPHAWPITRHSITLAQIIFAPVFGQCSMTS